MSEDRPGEGRIFSTEETKANLGRGFRRAEHTGENPNPTEWQASKNLAKDLGEGGPTEIEIEMAFEDNPRAVAAIRSAAEQKGRNLSDKDVYEMLKNYR